MIIQVTRLFDLNSTLQSGQAFRWRFSDGWFEGVIFGNLVNIREISGGLEFYSSPDDELSFSPLLLDYLGMAVDLDKVYLALSEDVILGSAIKKYSGMRILRQEPWECLISFICSSASNIPRISKNIESICDAFGEEIRFGSRVRRTFPNPEKLASVDESSLRELGLGYRAGYISATAKRVSDGEVDFQKLRKASYEEALDRLVSLEGVGDKVANCVMLFSLDKSQAFPVDVWIDRALREWYFKEERKTVSRVGMRLWAIDHFGPYAGYANQYLFHGRRLQDRRLQI